MVIADCLEPTGKYGPRHKEVSEISVQKWTSLLYFSECKMCGESAEDSHTYLSGRGWTYLIKDTSFVSSCSMCGLSPAGFQSCTSAAAFCPFILSSHALHTQIVTKIEGAVISLISIVLGTVFPSRVQVSSNHPIYGKQVLGLGKFQSSVQEVKFLLTEIKWNYL